MPPGTKLRNLRVNDSLWLRAKAVADKRGESLSDVLRGALERYIQQYE